MKDIIAGYRTMLGFNQQEMANVFGISRQAYYTKESGQVPFSDKEKLIFKEMVSQIFPEITIDQIFFTFNTKKCKEKEGK